MSDSSSGRHFAWLRQVQTDPKLRDSAFGLAFVISQGINAKTGVFFASHEKLAEKINANVRTVYRLIKVLRNSGHITVTSGGGRGKANEYRLAHKNPDIRVTVSEKETLTFVSKNPDMGVIPTNLILPTSSTLLRKDAAASDDEPILIPISKTPPDTPRTRLWREGLPMVMDFGVDDRRARGVIGRWLRDTDDDAIRVMASIEEARGTQRFDPIPWITACLQREGPSRSSRNTNFGSKLSVIEQIRREAREHDRMAASTAIEAGGARELN